MKIWDFLSAARLRKRLLAIVLMCALVTPIITPTPTIASDTSAVAENNFSSQTANQVRADQSAFDSGFMPPIINMLLSGNATGTGTGTGPTPNPAPSPTPSLVSIVNSESSNRANASNLNGQTVDNNIFVSVVPSTTVDRVRFFINDVLIQTENTAPFDLQGSRGGLANPFDTNELTNGNHTIRADILFIDQSSGSISASFIVANAGNTPPADPPTTPADPPTTPSDPPTTPSDPPNNGDADVVETDTEAANFLLQATFGPTADSISELRSLGYSEWFRQQINTDIAPYIDDAVLAEETTPSSRNRHRFAFNFWMQKATNGPDQLRQRAVFALSEIIATANNGSRLQRKSQLHATFKDHFQFNAFGNYRNLLQDVTYNPLMGRWLTYVGNRKADPATGSQPDENYAREVMQLFTIGLVELNIDGTPRTNNGEPIETYTQEDVVGLAKVFTGLYWAGTGFDRTESLHTRLPQDILPMDMHQQFHSEGPKTFLGQTLPDFGDGNRSITEALDVLFAHPNVAPFIGRQLIQRFTTSSPSNAYVERVATAFNDGRYTLPDGTQVGTGERGNLEPVFAAILFDPEARTANRFSDNNFAKSWGKIREPMIRFVHWMRVANVVNIDIQGIRQFNGDWLFDQRPFNAPSVFNFFRPGYVAPNTRSGDAGLTTPELQIAGDSNLIEYFNEMRDFIRNNTDDDSAFVPRDDYLVERSLADSAGELVDYFDLIYTPIK